MTGGGGEEEEVIRLFSMHLLLASAMAAATGMEIAVVTAIRWRCSDADRGDTGGDDSGENKEGGKMRVGRKEGWKEERKEGRSLPPQRLQCCILI